MQKKNTLITDYPQKIIGFLFHLIILVVPFFFTWVNEELFEFNKMILVYGFTVAIVATWIIRMMMHKRVLFHRTYLDIPLGLFVISQLISTVFSMHPRTSLFGYYTRFHGGLLSTFSYVALYYAFVSNFNKKQLKHFFLTIFIAAIGVSAYAIPEHFGHSPSCLLISGEFNVECWQQKVQDRIFGTFGQPNWLAAYAILLIPSGIGIFLKNSLSQSKKHTHKHLLYLTAIVIPLLGAVVTFTQSRSGFLGLAVGLSTFVIGLLIIFLRNKAEIRLFSIKSFAIILIPLIALIAYYGTPYTPSIKQITSGSTVPLQEETSPEPNPNRLDLGGTDSGEIRKIVWTGALDVWKRYPLFGSGVETFAYSYYTDRPMEHNLVSEWDFLYNKAHNELLNFLATTGLFGLLSYLSLFIWFGLKSLQIVWRKEENKSKNIEKKIGDKLTIIGLVSSVLALSVSNFLGFSTVMVSILMFLFFAFVAVLEKKEEPTPQQLKIQLEFWDYAQISVVGLIALFLLMQIHTIWYADYVFTKGKRLVDVGYISEGGPYLQKAIELRPNEDLFYDKFASTLGQAALIFADQEKIPEAQSAAQSAIIMSNRAVELNPVHLNIYKSRIRLFMMLGVLDKQLLAEAKQSSLEAIDLAPTDAKLVFNLGLIEQALGNSAEAQNYYQQAIEMKANYATAYNSLAELYLQQNEPQKALEQYKQILLHFPDDQATADKVASLEAQLRL